MTDQEYMQVCVQLAAKGQGKTSPNPMVGAVIVKNKKITGQGWHKKAGGPHAETIALRKAGAHAQGARIYITLEPCAHFGRTPPCVDQIINAGIEEVVIGMKDPNPLTNGKSVNKLRRAGIKVKVGILKKQCEDLNENFLKYIKNRLPFVVAKTAQTFDGKIALSNGDSRWITSNAARAFARKIRNGFDAVLVGSNTVRKDNPSLHAAHKTKRIKKIVLDSRLKTSFKAKLFKNTKPEDCFFATTKKAKEKSIDQFRKNGMNVIVCPQKNNQVHLRWLFEELAKREITSILIEGGSRVIGSALQERLVDRMHIYIAPKIIGDQNALSAVTGMRAASLNSAIRLKTIKCQRLGPDFLIQVNVSYK